MSGYVANARLQGGSLRFVAVAGSSAREAPGGSAAGATPLVDLDREQIELVGRPFGERLAARWADLCEAWSQTTFYLFDPDSWR